MDTPQKKTNQRSRFKKGNKAAAGPRRTTIKRIQQQQDALNAIFEEANKLCSVSESKLSLPIVIQQLMLKRGAALQLDVTTTIRLCDKLAPYMEAKKASLDIKHEVVPAYNVVENRVEIGTIPGSNAILVNEMES